MRREDAEKLSRIINDHLANIQRIGVNWSAEIIKNFKKAQEELMEYILSEQKTFGAVGIDSGTNKKFEIIRRKIEAIVADAYSRVYSDVQEEFSGLAENEAKHAANLTKAMSGSAVEQVGKRTIESIAKYGRFDGLTLSEMFNSLSTRDAGRIYGAVARNILGGSTPQSLRKAVQHVFDISNYQAQNIGLTCANGISNDARLAVFTQNDDVVKGIEILNTLDGRTCPTCAAIGGLRFNMDDKNIPVLPVHIRCRCCYIPVTVLPDIRDITRPAANSDFMSDAQRVYEKKYPDKDWNVLSESTKKKYYHQAIHDYEDRTGEPAFSQVPGSMKFKDYFELQDDHFKRDWLGVTRYRLYTKGNLSLNDMMNPQTDRLFTLSELKKRDIEAFRKAGLTGGKNSMAIGSG